MKSISRRDMLRGMALGATSAVIAACSPSAPAPAAAPPSAPATAAPAAPTAAPATADAIELRMGWWGGQARNILYNDICDLYQTKNPNITIVREYADWSPYWTKVATQAAGKNLPDITASVIDSLSEYAKRGAYMPLDPFIESKAIDTSDWPQSVLDGSKVDGKVYMMATGTTVQCVIVNQDLIKRAGLEPPKFETSFDEFAQFSKDLQAKLEKGAYASGDGAAYSEHFQGWILQKGYQIANEEGTDVGFPKEVMVEFFKFYKDLYDAGTILPIEISSEPLGDAWADSWLAKGQVAMHFINTNQLKIFQKYTKDDLVIMRNLVMPDGKQKYGDYLRPSALSMASNTKYPDEVARFINFFVNDLEATKIFNAELGAVAPKHVADELAKTVDPKDVLVFKHFDLVTKELPYKMPDPKGTSAVLAAHKRANESVRYGKATIEEAVDTFMKEAQEAYKAATAS